MIRLTCPSLDLSFETNKIDLSVRYKEWKMTSYVKRSDGITECHMSNGFITARFVTGSC